MSIKSILIYTASMPAVFLLGRLSEQVQSTRAEIVFAASRHQAFSKGDMSRLKGELTLDLKGKEKALSDPMHMFLWNLTKRGGPEHFLDEARAYARAAPDPTSD